MAEGNKDFLGGLVGKKADITSPRRPLATPTGVGILKSREDGLAEIAAGVRVENDKKLVDPATCVMWERHNRDYAALNETRCADLIESIKRHGKQEIPAIVRRLKGVENAYYEVICGARRHWAVSWLRANGYPDIKYLIEIRHLSDEEAFTVADLENRGREDITPFERARDYAAAVDLYYGGVQSRMAERLGVDRSYVSRMLDFAKLPVAFHEAFGSPHRISEKMGRRLSPLWKDGGISEALKTEIANLRDEQIALKETGSDFLDPKYVLSRILRAASEEHASPAPAGPLEYSAKNGQPMLKVEQSRNGGFKLTALPKSGATRAELVAAFERYLDTLPGDTPVG